MNAATAADHAEEFAHAAAVLATATRSWPTLPPVTRAELDAVATQVEGLRHALVLLKTTIPQK